MPIPPGPLWAQMATEDRLLYRGWWPRHSTPSGDEYVGPAECAKCHAGARTSVLVADAGVLAGHGGLTFQAGRISYQIATSAGKSVYTVTDGTRNVSATLTWSFGDGHIGQSYLFERDGKFYESRVSYFSTLKALEFTVLRKYCIRARNQWIVPSYHGSRVFFRDRCPRGIGRSRCSQANGRGGADKGRNQQSLPRVRESHCTGKESPCQPKSRSRIG